MARLDYGGTSLVESSVIENIPHPSSESIILRKIGWTTVKRENERRRDELKFEFR